MLLDGRAPNERASSVPQQANPLTPFTCSSFAHYSGYSKVVGPLLNISTMPLITDVERVDLEGVMNKDWIQPTPFRRLYPSYLMNAFQQDSYPFSPDDWEIFKHHSVFIPAEVSAA